MVVNLQAVALGAALLRREIELLAQRGACALRTLRTPPWPAAPSPVPSLGLPGARPEVLVLVAAGRTNHQIAEQLFSSIKTAGVHVSRIPAKLGVAGREEAAPVAHRLGLDKQ